MHEESQLRISRNLDYAASHLGSDYSFYCSICYTNADLEYCHPECDLHKFCKNCTLTYLRIKINESQVSRINCPGDGCQLEFKEEMIKTLVDEELFAKYQKFKWRLELMKDSSVKWCKTPDCDGYMKGSYGKPHLICPVCSFNMCFKCGND